MTPLIKLFIGKSISDCLRKNQLFFLMQNWGIFRRKTTPLLPNTCASLTFYIHLLPL